MLSFYDSTTSESQTHDVDFDERSIHRLPVYLILDISASMYGAPIIAVKEGVKLLCNQLLEMPSVRESVWISMITFGTTALECVKLTPLKKFQSVDLHAGGITSLGAAFDLLEKSIDRDVQVNLESGKGDWLPLVYLFTDGEPTDDWEPALNRLKSRVEKTVGAITLFASGAVADEKVLKKISSYVIHIDSISVDYLKNSFKWIPRTIKETNAIISDGETLNLLPPSS